LSFAFVQPLGQQPSPFLQLVIAVCVQAAVQVAAEPVSVSTLHALEWLQLVGHEDGGSQVSPTSMTPLPQLAEQAPQSWGQLVQFSVEEQMPSPHDGPVEEIIPSVQPATIHTTKPSHR
jgi:hypothetical protein